VCQKHRSMNTYGEWRLPTPFSTSALDEDEWSASRFGRFTPGTHWIGHRVSPRDRLSAVVFVPSALALRLFHSVNVPAEMFTRWSSLSFDHSLRANEIRYAHKGVWPLPIATSIIIFLTSPLTLGESEKWPCDPDCCAFRWHKSLEVDVSGDDSWGDEKNIRWGGVESLGPVAFSTIWLHPAKLSAPPTFTSKFTEGFRSENQGRRLTLCRRLTSSPKIGEGGTRTFAHRPTF
jgi:hypothetical protein